MFQKVTFYCLSLGILNIGYFSCQGSYKGDSFVFRNGTMIYHTYSGKIFRWFWIESINFWSLLLLRSSFWIFCILLLKLVPTIFIYFTKRQNLKIMKNAFCLTEKALSVHKIFSFFLFSSPFSYPFGRCWIYQRSWLKRSPKAYDHHQVFKQEFKNINRLIPWEVKKISHINLVSWQSFT